MSYMRTPVYVWDDGENIHIGMERIPMEIFDSFVVMRYAELAANQKKLAKAERKAIERCSGNIGCDELSKKYGKPTTVDFIKKLSKKLKE